MAHPLKSPHAPVRREEAPTPFRLFGASEVPEAGSEEREGPPEAWAGPTSYFEGWFEFSRRLIQAFRGDKETPGGAAARVGHLLARTEASIAAGIEIPIENFMRRNGFDLIDRLLLLALLGDAISPGSDGGLRLCDLNVAVGAESFEAQEVVRRRVEEGGALRSAELLECDMDVPVLKRFYRVAPRMVPLLMTGHMRDPLDGVNDVRAIDLLCGKLGELACTLKSMAACERHPGWYAAVRETREWVPWAGPAREVRDILDSIARRPTHRFTEVAREAALNDWERFLFGILVHAVWCGSGDVNADIASAAIERVYGKEVSPQRLTDTKCRLVYHQLADVTAERDARSRSLSLKPEVAGRVLVGAPTPPKAEPGGDGKDLWVEIEPKKKLEHLVLPDGKIAEIAEALENVRSAETIFGDWGFGGASYVGDGSVLLFEGPPGTGKTFAAEAIAGELELPLLRASVERLTSKWFGRTEKNVARLFTESLERRAVLLLDEADSLLTTRLETELSHHARHVNILLQQIEAYTSILILTTNRAPALDPALERRLTAHVRFEVPGPAERNRLWRQSLPYRAPTDRIPDFKLLAEKYVLTGSEIRSACLAAARAAARRFGADQVIRQEDLEAAARKAKKREVPAVGFGRVPSRRPVIGLSCSTEAER